MGFQRTDDDPPPADLDAERHLLGALLQDPERTMLASRSVGISVDDFFSPTHADVWRVALALQARGVVPDPVALRGHYEDNKQAEPLALLRTLALDLPANLYPSAWAERVREKGARRGLFYFGRKVADLGQNGTPAQESIAHAREHLDFLQACYTPATERYGWVLGEELLAEPEEDESAHLWLRIVVPGALTLIAGSPKAGKSWVLYAFAAQLSRGGTWLGRRVPRTKVAILSEEGRRTIRKKVKRFGCEDVLILPRSGVASASTWEETCRVAQERCLRDGIGCLIVDTFSHWADLAPDDEQKEGPIRRAMRPLQAVADAGIAVVASHHLGKSGAIRGSTALEQVPDVLVVLTCPDPGKPERVLSVRGRFEDEQGDFTVRHLEPAGEPDRYEALGPVSKARVVALCDPIRAWLATHKEWAKSEEIREGIEGARKADVLAALAMMVESRTIQRIGKGNTTRYASLDVPLPA